MLRHIVSGRALAAAAMAIALAAPLATAQERGEEIVGTISSVNGRNLAVKHQDGRDIRISVTPSTEVYFQDSGDRKLFPNPGIDDLREGMGVRFVYNGGTPTKVTVHFVPAGFQRGAATAPADPGSISSGASEQLKVRIKSIDNGGRQMRVDVAGRERRYNVASGEANRFREGDLVLITASGGTVTRIDSADEGGIITRLSSRSVTIDVNGREQTYDVERQGLLEDYREGDRVTFQVEDRSNGRKVITGMERRSRPR
jgi:hypothetical protein